MNEDTFFDFFPEISEKSIKLIFHFPTLLFSGKLASFPQKLGFEKNRYKIFLGKKRGAARNFERHSVCAPYSIVSLKYVICKVQKICGVCADLRRLPQVFADFFRFSIRNESLILSYFYTICWCDFESEGRYGPQKLIEVMFTLKFGVDRD